MATFLSCISAIWWTTWLQVRIRILPVFLQMRPVPTQFFSGSAVSRSVIQTSAPYGSPPSDSCKESGFFWGWDMLHDQLDFEIDIAFAARDKDIARGLKTESHFDLGLFNIQGLAK